MTTITAEERARWKSRLNANAGLYDIHLKDMLRKALDALEIAEKRLKAAYIADMQRLLELIEAAEAHVTIELQRACEVSGHFMQMSVDLNETVEINHALKERAEKAEAERDVLADLIASGGFDCPGHDAQCPFGAGDDGSCLCERKTMGSDMRCWRAWAAQEVERQAAENRKDTTPS